MSKIIPALLLTVALLLLLPAAAQAGIAPSLHLGWGNWRDKITTPDTNCSKGVTENLAMDTSTTTLNVAGHTGHSESDNKYTQVGDVLTNRGEQVLVTAINTSTHELNVTRGHNSTTAVAHYTDDEWTLASGAHADLNTYMMYPRLEVTTFDDSTSTVTPSGSYYSRYDRYPVNTIMRVVYYNGTGTSSSCPLVNQKTAFYDPGQATPTLSTAVNTTDTTFTFSTNLNLDAGEFVKIDSEVIKLGTLSGRSWTGCTRDVCQPDGASKLASHSAGAACQELAFTAFHKVGLDKVWLPATTYHYYVELYDSTGAEIKRMPAGPGGVYDFTSAPTDQSYASNPTVVTGYFADLRPGAIGVWNPSTDWGHTLDIMTGGSLPATPVAWFGGGDYTYSPAYTDDQDPGGGTFNGVDDASDAQMRYTYAFLDPEHTVTDSPGTSGFDRLTRTTATEFGTGNHEKLNYNYVAGEYNMADAWTAWTYNYRNGTSPYYDPDYLQPTGYGADPDYVGMTAGYYAVREGDQRWIMLDSTHKYGGAYGKTLHKASTAGGYLGTASTSDKTLCFSTTSDLKVNDVLESNDANEKVHITSIDSSTQVTVDRAVNGSTLEVHSQGDLWHLFFYDGSGSYPQFPAHEYVGGRVDGAREGTIGLTQPLRDGDGDGYYDPQYGNSNEANWLIAELKAWHDNSHTKALIVFLHHPLIGAKSSSAFMGANYAPERNRLRELFKNYGVDLVLEGDQHSYARYADNVSGTSDYVHYIRAGSAGIKDSSYGVYDLGDGLVTREFTDEGSGSHYDIVLIKTTRDVNDACHLYFKTIGHSGGSSTQLNIDPADSSWTELNLVSDHPLP